MRRNLLLSGLILMGVASSCGSEVVLPSSTPVVGSSSSAPLATAAPDANLRVEVVQDGAPFPVAMAFAPDGRLFYLSRTEGAVVALSFEGGAGGASPSAATVLDGLPLPRGQGDGPLGMALAPDFEQSGHLYVYYTDTTPAGHPERVPIARYTVVDGRATEETIIVGDLPVDQNQRFHFGGGLSFGPDGKLYLIYGDTDRAAVAHDPTYLGGSVLRYNPDGTIPDDNPFPGSPVYSYGHRNGFGLAWQPQSGAMYESENGNTCDDELNLIRPGEDYGWGAFERGLCPYPDEQGVAPLYQWTPNIAPTALLFYTADVIPEFEGDLLMCAFNSGHLYHITLSGNGQRVEHVEEIVLEVDPYCQLDVVQGPDGWLYGSTTDAIYRLGR